MTTVGFRIPGVMIVRYHDPHASLGSVVVLSIAAVIFVALAVLLYAR